MIQTIINALRPRQRMSEAERRALRIDTLGPLQGTFTGNDAKEAIAFALELNDPFNAEEFLRAWQVGDTREWPDFEPDVVRS